MLAGFNKGSELLLRLMKEEFDSPQLQSRLITAYLIGWRITQTDCAEYRYLKPAISEDDLGVIVSFNTEPPEIKRTIIVPHETIRINPLIGVQIQIMLINH